MYSVQNFYSDYVFVYRENKLVSAAAAMHPCKITHCYLVMLFCHTIQFSYIISCPKLIES